jgi:NADH:ubiquinone oxidoreductase subunit C
MKTSPNKQNHPWKKSFSEKKAAEDRQNKKKESKDYKPPKITNV